MTLGDLNVLKTKTAVYELSKDAVYVVLCDGKHFSFELASALFASAAEDGLNLHIIVSQHPKSIEVKVDEQWKEAQHGGAGTCSRGERYKEKELTSRGRILLVERSVFQDVRYTE